MVRFNKSTSIGEDDLNEINYQKIGYKEYFSSYFFNVDHKPHKYIHNRFLASE